MSRRWETPNNVSGICAVLEQVCSSVLEAIDLHFDAGAVASLLPWAWEDLDSALMELLPQAPIRHVRIHAPGAEAVAIKVTAALPRMESMGLLQFQNKKK
jgi:hypothetical protein